MRFEKYLFDLAAEAGHPFGHWLLAAPPLPAFRAAAYRQLCLPLADAPQLRPQERPWQLLREPRTTRQFRLPFMVGA